MLNAPLDWPDCCALCSDTTINGTTAAACAGWSFHPATGSCQLMSEVSLGNITSTAWSVNGTVNGYPGYFEAPVTGCWSRTGFDLCDNMNLYLLIAGVVLAFFGLLGFCRGGVVIPSKSSGLLRKLLADGQSRLKKASCVEVSATRLKVNSGKGGPTHINVLEGTFMTREGFLFVVSELGEKVTAPPHSRSIEQKMLSVLFMNNLRPLANRDVAARCQTPQGLRSEFLSLLKRTILIPVLPTEAVTRRRVQADGSPDFDCLLLVGASCSNGQNQPANKVRRKGSATVYTCRDRR